MQRAAQNLRLTYADYCRQLWSHNLIIIITILMSQLQAALISTRKTIAASSHYPVLEDRFNFGNFSSNSLIVRTSSKTSLSGKVTNTTLTIDWGKISFSPFRTSCQGGISSLGSWRSRQKMGRQEVKEKYELWQTQQSPEVRHFETLMPFRWLIHSCEWAW